MDLSMSYAYLYYKYVVLNWTREQLAEELKLGKTTVQRRLNHFGISKDKIKKIQSCTNCGKSTSNKKFCSRSCSNIINKRKNNQVNKCIDCGRINSVTRKRCRLCRKQFDYKQRNLTTLGELKTGLNNYHSKIREHARKVYDNETAYRICAKCDYDIYTEICHITPVKDFNDEHTLGDVNAVDNLICLCPNCHKEFDNELFTILIVYGDSHRT